MSTKTWLRLAGAIVACVALLLLAYIWKNHHTRPDTQAPAKQPISAAPATKPVDPWKSLFDGKDLEASGWDIAQYGAHGDVAVKDGMIFIKMGEGLTGVTYTKDVPKMNYELTVTGKRTDGHDFFCGITFPVADSHASFIPGGWGGAVCGISSLDGHDASDNETTKYKNFDENKWYTFRVRVLPHRLQAWVDQEQIVDVDTTDKRISVRNDIAQSKPLGLATWQSTAYVKDIKIRELTAAEIAAGEKKKDE